MTETLPHISWAVEDYQPSSFCQPSGSCEVMGAFRGDLKWVLEGRKLTEPYEKLFVPTNPWWYGLWMQSPLSPQQCSFLTEFLACIELYWRGYDMQQLLVLKVESLYNKLNVDRERFNSDRTELLLALRFCAQLGHRLHVRHIPAGYYAFADESMLGDIVALPHCPRCHMDLGWSDFGAPEEALQTQVKCESCGQEFTPADTNRKIISREVQQQVMKPS